MILAVVGAALLLTYAVMWNGWVQSNSRASSRLQFITNAYRYSGMALLVLAVLEHYGWSLR